MTKRQLAALLVSHSLATLYITAACGAHRLWNDEVSQEFSKDASGTSPLTRCERPARSQHLVSCTAKSEELQKKMKNWATANVGEKRITRWGWGGGGAKRSIERAL